MDLASYYATLTPSSRQIVQAHTERVGAAGGIGVDEIYLERVVALLNELGEWDNLRVAVSPRFGYDLVNGKVPKLYNLKKGDCASPSETMQGTVQANAVKGHAELTGATLGYFGKAEERMRNNNVTVYQVFQVNTAILVGLFGLLYSDTDTDTVGEYTLYVDRRNLASAQLWSASRGNQNSFSVTGAAVKFTELNGASGLVVLCHKMHGTKNYFRNQAGNAESAPFENLYNDSFRHYGLFSRTKSSFSLNGRFVDTLAFNGLHTPSTEAAIYNFLLTEYNNT